MNYNNSNKTKGNTSQQGKKAFAYSGDSKKRSPDQSTSIEQIGQLKRESPLQKTVIQREGAPAGVYYHATSKTAWQSIREVGLDPTWGGRGTGISETTGTKEDSTGRIFFIDSIGTARKVIAPQLKDPNGEAVIIGFYAPKDFLNNSSSGDSMGGQWTSKPIAGSLLYWIEDAKCQVLREEELSTEEIEEVQTEKKKKKCFLTTACCQWKGLPDDCEELTVLRAFRDGYMQNLPNGHDLIETYYKVAPGMVNSIENSPNKDQILTKIYCKIQTCLKLIKTGKENEAFSIYREMVIEQNQYNN